MAETPRTAIRKPATGIALYEALVAAAAILLLLAFLWALMERVRESARRGLCARRLAALGRAQHDYAGAHGGWWTFAEDGRGERDLNSTRGLRNPCASLSLLYPAWVPDLSAFACPSTRARPRVLVESLGVHRFSWFGKMDDAAHVEGTYPDIPREYPGQKFCRENSDPLPADWGLPGTYADYATPAATGRTGPFNTSFGYDDLVDWRLALPDTVRAADMVSRDRDGAMRSNHKADGQNVLHWDGHVRFSDTAYASSAPQDNIYRGGADAEDARDVVVMRTHADL